MKSEKASCHLRKASCHLIRASNHLKENCCCLKEEFDSLKEDTNTLKEECSSVKEDINILKEEFDSLKEKCSAVKKASISSEVYYLDGADGTVNLGAFPSFYYVFRHKHVTTPGILSAEKTNWSEGDYIRVAIYFHCEREKFFSGGHAGYATLKCYNGDLKGYETLNEIDIYSRAGSKRTIPVLLHEAIHVRRADGWWDMLSANQEPMNFLYYGFLYNDLEGEPVTTTLSLHATYLGRIQN